MDVIWRKVWFDLWSNKVRTSLAVLSIAVGVEEIFTRLKNLSEDSAQLR